MKIKKAFGLEILDSRGNPTVKGYIQLEDGTIGTAAVPSGASTGTHEALELRDNVKNYGGKGVTKALENIKKIISPELSTMDIEDLEAIDKKMLELDGTENKSKLGANAMLAISLASADALSFVQDKSLWQTLHDVYFPQRTPAFPRLMVNVINGGAHADWTLDFQEWMLSPVSNTPSISVRIAAEVFHTLKQLLKKDGFTVSVGDEGGFAPKLSSNKAAFEYLEKAIELAGYSRKDVDLAADIAASEFFKNDMYHLTSENKSFSKAQMSDYYDDLIKSHNVMSFEDPFAEDDWVSFKAFTKNVGAHHMIVGDDLYVTNPERIKKGVEESATNAVLIKVNQIGTLYETVQAINMTFNAGWKAIISHRSGETEDPFIADLAFACGAQFIKTGSMSRSERIAKYNRLLEIEAFEI